MSYFNQIAITYADSFAIDPFGRLRVSEPDTLFDSKPIAGKAALFWDESIAGSATSAYVANGPHVLLSVTTTGDDVIRQTFQRFNYMPGKGQLFLITGVFGEPVADTTWNVGAYDGTDGVYLYSDGTTVGLSVSNNGSDDNYGRANWNKDTMDGNGPSGINLDFDKAQILYIDFEWLGVGRVRAGFVIDGVVYYAHEWNNANSVTDCYMATPNLPVRYRIASTGGSASMKAICSSVASEGGIQDTGIVRGANMGVTAVGSTTAGTSYALVGMRLNSSYLDSVVLQSAVSVMATSNSNFLWELVLNPTVTGTFTYSNLTNSPVDYAIGAGATVTGGTRLSHGYVASASRSTKDALKSLRWIGSSIAGTPDELVLAATPTQNNTNLLGALEWRELS